MFDNHEALIALRTRLLTVEIATTGSTTLVATGTGFTRATGSFLNDNLVAGMEVTPTGFTDNSIGMIKSLTVSEIKLWQERSAESSGAGRSLTVGIPAIRGWENEEVERIAHRWYMDEDYIPGTPIKFGLGPFGKVETTPTYVIKVEGLPKIGSKALFALAQGIVDVFPPALAITLAGGDIVYVGTDPGPWPSQALPNKANMVEIVITIPLNVLTNNPI